MALQEQMEYHEELINNLEHQNLDKKMEKEKIDTAEDELAQVMEDIEESERRVEAQLRFDTIACGQVLPTPSTLPPVHINCNASQDISYLEARAASFWLPVN